jgi:hypothetical protein
MQKWQEVAGKMRNRDELSNVKRKYEPKVIKPGESLLFRTIALSRSFPAVDKRFLMLLI